MNFIDTIISMLPAATQAAVNWRVDPTTRQFQQTSIPALSATESRSAKGFEIDMVGRITDNWSILLNVGQQETTLTNIAPALTAASKEVIANLQANSFWLANHLISAKNALLWEHEYNRLFEWPFQAEKSLDGQISLEQREWRVNLATNYLFDEGFLRGFNVGLGYRWQSEVAIGYDYDEVVELDLFLPDLTEPIFGPTESNLDLWFGYNRDLNIFNRKVNWKIQVNIRNAFKDETLIPIGADPDGRLRQFRSPSPTEFYVTNTIRW